MGGIDEHLKLSNVSIPCLSLCLNFSEDTLPKYANNFSITWGREQCLSFLPLIALKSWSKTEITEREVFFFFFFQLDYKEDQWELA